MLWAPWILEVPFFTFAQILLKSVLCSSIQSLWNSSSLLETIPLAKGKQISQHTLLFACTETEIKCKYIRWEGRQLFHYSKHDSVCLKVTLANLSEFIYPVPDVKRDIDNFLQRHRAMCNKNCYFSNSFKKGEVEDSKLLGSLLSGLSLSSQHWIQSNWNPAQAWARLVGMVPRCPEWTLKSLTETDALYLIRWHTKTLQ